MKRDFPEVLTPLGAYVRIDAEALGHRDAERAEAAAENLRLPDDG